MIDLEGKIVLNQNKRLSRIFSIEGTNQTLTITQLLQRTSLNSKNIAIIENAVNISLGEDDSTFYVNKSHFPKKLCFEVKGQPRFLSLSWIPVKKQNQVIEILVIIHDQSEIEFVKEQMSYLNDELSLIEEIVNISADKFDRFVKSSKRFLLRWFFLCFTKIANRNIFQCCVLFLVMRKR